MQTWLFDCSPDFNPHSRKGSDLITLNELFVHADFNPHSRKGSDIIKWYMGHKTYISIHTPARGVTRTEFLLYQRLAYFNPHSRKGSDHTVSDSIGEHIISIHTPARGVTGAAITQAPAIAISIHTPARGVTPVQ